MGGGEEHCGCQECFGEGGRGTGLWECDLNVKRSPWGVSNKETK